VPVAQVGGSVSACPSGYAHPNICCDASGGATACVTDTSSPFQPCGATSGTYPDPTTCCSLSDPISCAGSGGSASGGSSGGGSTTVCSCPDNDPSCACSVEVDAGVVGVPPVCNCPDNDPSCTCVVPADAGITVVPTCTYSCPPGAYTPAGSPAGTCCEADGNAIACSAPASDPCPPVVCPAGENCTAPACPSVPACAVCPPGWQVPEGSPELCCQINNSDVIACFSQATGPSSGFGSSGGGSTVGSTGPVDAGISVGFAVDASAPVPQP
jgi:hypothetical protein